jgi:hypothetical protein
LPGAPKLLDVVPRPISEISGGKRHVPKIVFTSRSRTSFLRYSKPQSPYLSRVLRQKDDTRVKRFEIAERMLGEIEEGRREDDWDDILEEEVGVEAEGEWNRAVAGVRGGTLKKYSQDAERGNKLALKMMEVVEKERELADRERKERKHAELEEKWKTKREKWMREGKEVRDIIKKPFATHTEQQWEGSQRDSEAHQNRETFEESKPNFPRFSRENDVGRHLPKNQSKLTWKKSVGTSSERDHKTRDSKDDRILTKHDYKSNHLYKSHRGSWRKLLQVGNDIDSGKAAGGIPTTERPNGKSD